jgi:hypothetical protein
MITTILAVVALSGSLAPAAKPEFQAQTDYGQALKMAADEKKPMAVLIGKGDTFAKLMADAGLSDEAKKLLSDKFVCVTVDVSTASGSQLAGQFQLTDGLVISSTGGTYQAFRQSGAVSAADLAKHAATYANVGSAPTTTATAGAPVITSTSFYADTTPATAAPAAGSAPLLTIGGCANGSCGTVTTSGCANGSCGTSYSGYSGGRRGFRR